MYIMNSIFRIIWQNKLGYSAQSFINSEHDASTQRHSVFISNNNQMLLTGVC